MKSMKILLDIYKQVLNSGIEISVENNGQSDVVSRGIAYLYLIYLSISFFLSFFVSFEECIVGVVTIFSFSKLAQGYLMKKSKSDTFRSWRKRFFVVTEKNIIYHEKEGVSNILTYPFLTYSKSISIHSPQFFQER